MSDDQSSSSSDSDCSVTLDNFKLTNIESTRTLATSVMYSSSSDEIDSISLLSMVSSQIVYLFSIYE